MNDSDFKYCIGATLRLRRNILGIRQKNLAKAAHISTVTMCKIEQGYGCLSLVTLRRLAEALNTPLWKVIKKCEKLRSREGMIKRTRELLDQL